ncbi:hypothetical protein PROFUN_16467 [Planoprotostelium fungivorum]|uniref:Uncharacterized protein n=1 Tax=Planoprotostelium fungivorum TaxID=1890364 RepID=A0A2P6MPZ5_9EUKA|nr:hypothetical protein PROFUN_16467 [Planoprotostelium fungivorum]
MRTVRKGSGGIQPPRSIGRTEWVRTALTLLIRNFPSFPPLSTPTLVSYGGVKYLSYKTRTVMSSEVLDVVYTEVVASVPFVTTSSFAMITTTLSRETTSSEQFSYEKIGRDDTMKQHYTGALSGSYPSLVNCRYATMVSVIFISNRKYISSNDSLRSFLDRNGSHPQSRTTRTSQTVIPVYDWGVVMVSHKQKHLNVVR